MIISHRYKFIFLKTEKTASSSLSKVFKRVVQEHDTLYPADRSTRRALMRTHGTLEGFSFIGRRGFVRRNSPALLGLHRHARAADVRAFLGPALFDRYTVITSERNPYDRQVSLLGHRKQSQRADISDFSRLTCSPAYNLLHYNRLDNWGIYTLDGRVCAQHVIRFETLEEDLAKVLTVLGVDPARFVLPHAKPGTYARGTSYRQFYNEKARRLVSQWYRREIDYFGYEF
jgi:hypothetical protein